MDPRPKLSWSDLAGARAGIWGLGREGHANLRKLLTLGVEPVLVDDRPAGPVDGRPVLATADGGLAARRRDRDHDPLLPELAAEVASWPDAPSEAQTAALLRPVGRNFIPNGCR